MITYKIHLIRTGTTQVDSKRLYTGQINSPLSQVGKDHLFAMKYAFEYPQAQVVYSSPLGRCLETAEILYPETQVIPINGLMDMNLGSFEGKSFEELEFDTDFVNWINNSAENSPPGGESTMAFTRRIVGAIDEIFHDMMNQKLTNVAAITHGGVIMTLLSTIAQPRQPMNEWAVDNGVGYTILMTPQLWMQNFSCEVFNHVPILREDPSFSL